MIRADFHSGGGFYCFNISGHSARGEAGSDIVCAAVSAMAMLTLNILEALDYNFTACTDEKKPEIKFEMKNPDFTALTILNAFGAELSALRTEYPENIKVIFN